MLSSLFVRASTISRRIRMQSVNRALPRRILLVAANNLTLKYLRNTADVFEGDDRLHFTLTMPYSTAHTDITGPEAGRRIGVPYVTYARAKWSDWDQIWFANQGYAGGFDERIPKIYVTHGLPAGMRVGGRGYPYSPGYTMRRGKLIYSAMFLPSEYFRHYVIRQAPALASCLMVVGDLRCDRIKAMNEQRESIRQSLGLDGRPTVLLMSTWGPNSVLDRRGPALLEEVRELCRAGRFQFIVSSHPNLWADRIHHHHEWARILPTLASDDIIVLDPRQQDWEKYVVAADMAVSDNTSMSLYFATTAKPIMYYRFPDEVSADSPMGLSMQHNVQCDPTTPLRTALDRLLEESPRMDRAPLVELINSQLGSAAKNIRSVVYPRLDLADAPQLHCPSHP